MGQFLERINFRFESLTIPFLSCQLRRKDLDRRGPARLDLDRRVNRPHASTAELFADLVGTQFFEVHVLDRSTEESRESSAESLEQKSREPSAESLEPEKRLEPEKEFEENDVSSGRSHSGSQLSTLDSQLLCHPLT